MPLIDDFADKCLAESLKESVRSHIDSCPECESKLNETQRLKTLLQRLAVPCPALIYFNEATDLILTRIADERRAHQEIH